MNREVFTIEEVNLICMCDTETRDGLIVDLKRMNENLIENKVEFEHYILSIIQKLEEMTEDEYNSISKNFIGVYE